LAKKSRQRRETWRDERANPIRTTPLAKSRAHGAPVRAGRRKRKQSVVESSGNAREGIGSASGGLILRAIGRVGVLCGHRQIGDGIVHARDGVGFA